MWLEIKKILMRRQYWFTMILLTGSVILDYLTVCKEYYGAPLSQVRSAYHCTVLKNDVPNIASVPYNVLFPILACIMCSDIYYEEHKLGISNFLYTRSDKRADLLHKLFAVFIVSFLSFFAPLLLNLGLSVITFPIQGHYASYTTYLSLVNLEPDRMLSYLEAYHPYWNILCFILIRCLIASLIAVLSYSISLVFTTSRYFVLLSGFIYYILYSNLTNLIPNDLLNTILISVNGYGSIWAIFLFSLFTIFLIVLCYQAGKRKETI